jgi:transcription elongation factor GreA-like protein
MKIVSHRLNIYYYKSKMQYLELLQYLSLNNNFHLKEVWEYFQKMIIIKGFYRLTN